MDHALHPDTQALLLLCSPLEEAEPPELLRPRELAALLAALATQGLRPGDLLAPEGMEQVALAAGLETARLHLLVERGLALALAVERWTGAGLWVLSCCDDDYPARYRDRLASQAPPLLYGAGDRGLLAAGGLAVVGSRQTPEATLAFAGQVGERCAAEGLSVISGGAKGVDAAAMQGCLEAGGRAVGICADTLARRAVAGECRDLIEDGRLALLSPFVPRAGFSVGQAMARNKLIYALADWALVVDAAAGQGGTWSGATENLEQRWTPLFVYRNGLSEGNEGLLKMGALPFDAADLGADTPLADLLATRACRQSSPPSADDLLHRLLGELAELRSPADLAQRLGLPLGRVRAVLEQALARGLVTKQKKPVRYLRTDPTDTQLPMF